MNNNRQRATKFNNLLKLIARSTKDTAISKKILPHQNDNFSQNYPRIFPREHPLPNPSTPQTNSTTQNQNSQLIEKLNQHIKELDEKVKQLELVSDALKQQNNDLTTAISYLSVNLAKSNENTDKILEQNNKLIEIISVKLFQDQPSSKRRYEDEKEDAYSDSSAKTVADAPPTTLYTTLNTSNLKAHEAQYSRSFPKEKFPTDPLYDENKSHVSFDINQGQDYNYNDDDNYNINVNDMENLHFETSYLASRSDSPIQSQSQPNTGLFSQLNFFNKNNQ